MPFTSRKQFFYLLYNEPEVFMEWVEDYGVPKEFKVGSTEHWLMQIKKMDPKRSMSRMKKKMLRGAESFGAEDVYDNEADALKRAKELGCNEVHKHETDNGTVFMPCKTHEKYEDVLGAESFEADGISRVSHMWILSFDFNEREISWYDEILPLLREYKHSSNYPLESYNFNFFEDSEGDWITVEAFSRSKIVLQKLKLDLDDELEGYIHYDAESFEADGDIIYVVETIKNNKVISKSKDFNNSKDALKLFKEKTSNKSKDEQIQVMEYRDYGNNLFGDSIYADEKGIYDAENWGGDPEGPLAKALEKARKKSRQPKKPLVIESMWYKRVDPKDSSRYYYSKGNRPEYTEDDIKYGAYIRSGGGTWNEEQNAKGFGWDNNLGRLVRLPDDLTFSAEEQIHEDTLTNKEIKTNVVYPLLLGILGGTIATVVGNLWSIEIAKKRGHL